MAVSSRIHASQVENTVPISPSSASAMRRPLTELRSSSASVWPHTRVTSSRNATQMANCTSAEKKCLSRSRYGDVRPNRTCRCQCARGRTTADSRKAAASSSEVITARRDTTSTLSGRASVASTVAPASTTTGTGQSTATARRNWLPVCWPLRCSNERLAISWPIGRRSHSAPAASISDEAALQTVASSRLSAPPSTSATRGSTSASPHAPRLAATKIGHMPRRSRSSTATRRCALPANSENSIATAAVTIAPHTMA